MNERTGEGEQPKLTVTSEWGTVSFSYFKELNALTLEIDRYWGMPAENYDHIETCELPKVMEFMQKVFELGKDWEPD